MPFPVSDLRHINTVLVDVLLVLNQLVVHLLNQVRTAVSELRQCLNSILYKVESVNLILNTHIERCCDCSFFLVSVYSDVLVCTSVCQLVNQSMIAVECEDNRLGLL